MHTQIYYNRLCDRTIDGTALHPTPPAAPLAGRHPPADTPASRPKTAGTPDLKAGGLAFFVPGQHSRPKTAGALITYLKGGWLWQGMIAVHV